MSAGEQAVALAAYAGMGAAAASVAVAAIGARAHKGEARAHAASLLTEAAATLADRQSAMITDQADNIRKLRVAVRNLIDAYDEAKPVFSLSAQQLAALAAVPPEKLKRLEHAIWAVTEAL